MAPTPGYIEADAAALAAKLSERFRLLERTVDEVVRAIDRDHAELVSRSGPSEVVEALSEAVAGRLSKVADDCEEVAAILERFRELTPIEAAREVPPPSVASADDDRSGPSPGVVAGDFPDAARLLATQMAMAGASAREITDRLRAEIGLSDARALALDVVTPSGDDA